VPDIQETRTHAGQRAKSESSPEWSPEKGLLSILAGYQTEVEGEGCDEYVI
jgi:hypothetical protein